MEEKEARGKEVLKEMEKKIHSIERKGAFLFMSLIIAFAVSLSGLVNPGLPLFSSNEAYAKILYGVFLGIFSLCAGSSAFFLVEAFYPWEKDEDEEKGRDLDDIEEVASMDEGEIEESLHKERDYASLIKKKATLGKKKAAWLRYGILLFAGFFLFLIALSVMAIFIQ